MSTEQAIAAYLQQLPPKQAAELTQLHQRILAISGACKLWFLDGKNAEGKVVSNPNIGYGSSILNYANGSSREFYKLGICATKTGLSVYFMGLTDKDFLKNTFGMALGKAKITGYCISFKSLNDIDTSVLEAGIQQALN